jgi:hypothetical protein
MKARMRVAAPQETEVTLQITMTVEQWQVVSKSLNNENPCYWLRGAIERAGKRIFSVIEEEVDITSTTPPPAP